MCKISVIIPVLNEEHALLANLPLLQSWRQSGHEVIVVDGGSTDTSVGIAEEMADSVLLSTPGRSSQMNNGAVYATGDILLFLHIDTLLPERADQQVMEALQIPGKVWGRFDVRLSGKNPVFRLIEALMNLRSRITGIATGDQALFVNTAVFKEVGTYPDIPLMEDVVISKKLRSRSWPVCLSQKVLSSSRRWEQHGIMRTVLLMWRLRLAFFLGADPHELHARYYSKSS